MSERSMELAVATYVKALTTPVSSSTVMLIREYPVPYSFYLIKLLELGVFNSIQNPQHLIFGTSGLKGIAFPGAILTSLVPTKHTSP